MKKKRSTWDTPKKKDRIQNPEEGNGQIEKLSETERLKKSALDISHIHVTSNRSYNNEDALQSAIYPAFIYALNRYTVIREMAAGKGFADVVFIPFRESDPAMIIELKRNGSADSSLSQILHRQYFDSLSH